MQPVVDPMADPGFIMAANKVMAIYPGYNTINDLMEGMKVDVQGVMNLAAETNPDALNEAVDTYQQTDNVVNELSDNVGAAPVAASQKVKTYNLKKAQNMMQPPADPMGLNDSPEMMGDPMQQQDEFNQEVAPPEEDLIFDEESLKNFIATHDEVTAVDYFEGHITDEQSKLMAKVELKELYEEIPEMPLDPARKTMIYANLLKYLGKDTMEIPVQHKQFEEANGAIKKLAEEHVAKNKKKKATSYNLKTAQHKTQENVVMFGPDNTRIDPFYRMPVSDWHIMERNKGWGQDIGGIWNIDYETLWRTHIMDKYTRPYKDKDGNLVGGYINKRFEVDSNIPEANNIQLKPGQRRKPYLPEYGSTEARLQDARSKGTVVGGPNVDRTKPFNWKEASSKKKS